jgi:hypothetical protein
VTNDAFRTAVAAGCVIGATYIHFSGTIMFTIGVVLWLLLAMGAGFMRPSGWMLFIAPVPWIAGVSLGVLLGRHESFGEVWLLPFALSTIAGLIGVTFGVAARKNDTRSKREQHEIR